MKSRILIADDEELARQRIRRLLEVEPEIEVVGECDDGLDALAVIRRERPDLVFLDVQMPALDGFGVLAALEPDVRPVVIFTTAHDQHALRAFEARALDYLLKPFKQDRFRDALSRARAQIALQRAEGNASATPKKAEIRGAASEYLTRLPVKDRDRVLFVRTTEIDSIEAAGKYVVVHVGKESYVLRESLSALETQLQPEKFLRISRSTIVNLDRVRELQPLFKGEHAVVLQNGRQLTMTRGFREVEDALKFS